MTNPLVELGRLGQELGDVGIHFVKGHVFGPGHVVQVVVRLVTHVEQDRVERAGVEGLVSFGRRNLDLALCERCVFDGRHSGIPVCQRGLAHDDDGAGPGDHRRKFPRLGGAGGTDRDLHTFEGGGLDALEAEVATWGNAFEIGQVGAACVCGYLDFRFADLNWRAGRPKLAAWFERASQRASVRDTAPPS